MRRSNHSSTTITCLSEMGTQNYVLFEQEISSLDFSTSCENQRVGVWFWFLAASDMSSEMPLTSRCTTLGFWPLGTKNVHGLLLWLCVGCHLLETEKIQWFFSIPISCISSRIGGWHKQDVDLVGFDGCVGICCGFFAFEWDRANGGDWTCGTGTSQEQNRLHPSQSCLCCFRGPFRIQCKQCVQGPEAHCQNGCISSWSIHHQIAIARDHTNRYPQILSLFTFNLLFSWIANPELFFLSSRTKNQEKGILNPRLQTLNYFFSSGTRIESKES